MNLVAVSSMVMNSKRRRGSGRIGELYAPERCVSRLSCSFFLKKGIRQEDLLAAHREIPDKDIKHISTRLTRDIAS